MREIKENGVRIRLTATERKQLEEKAAEADRTLSDYIRHLIRKELKQEEKTP